MLNAEQTVQIYNLSISQGTALENNDRLLALRLQDDASHDNMDNIPDDDDTNSCSFSAYRNLHGNRHLLHTFSLQEDYVNKHCQKQLQDVFESLIKKPVILTNLCSQYFKQENSCSRQL